MIGCLRQGACTAPAARFTLPRGCSVHVPAPHPQLGKARRGAGWAGGPSATVTTGGPRHTAISPKLLPQGCLALQGMLGPAKTVGSKGLILRPGGSAVQGNGRHWVFGLQSLVRSPCLCLSVPWWRGV